MTVMQFQHQVNMIYANINKRYSSTLFLLTFIYIIHVCIVDLTENAQVSEEIGKKSQNVSN